MGLYDVKTAVLKNIPLSNGKRTKITVELVEQGVNHERKYMYVVLLCFLCRCKAYIVYTNALSANIKSYFS